MHTNLKNSAGKRRFTGMLTKMLGMSALAIALNCANVQGQIINTVAGTGTSGYTGDGGAATAARFDLPADVEASYTVSGEYYIVDAASHVVRKVSPSGVVTTIAGTGTAGYTGDGGPATAARLSNPKSLDIDHWGNIYISDYDNNVIRRVSAAGIITTFAGTGSFGYSGDGGPATAAELNGAWGIETDEAGNVYIADVDNNVIRKVTKSTGRISTIAGTGTGSWTGDGGPATAATLNQPSSLSFDGFGNLFILDHQNNRIRKINTSGTISTYGGNGLTGYTGDGGPATNARLRIAWGIDCDDLGNVYISDEGNRVIRKIDISGNINTVVGTGSTGYTGDGGPATAATLGSTLEGLGIDLNGNLLIADQNNHVVRKVTNLTNFPPVFNDGSGYVINLCTNYGAFNIDENLQVRDKNIGQTMTWSVAVAPLHGTASVSSSTTTNGFIVRSTGSTYTPNTDYSGLDSMTIMASDGVTTTLQVFQINVHALPSVPVISGTSTICYGTTTTLSASPSGGTWFAYDGNGSVTSGGVVTAIGGLYTRIGYVSPIAPYGCRSVATDTVFFMGRPTSTLSGASSVCPGSCITLTPSVGGGSWSSTNSAIATVSGGLVCGVSCGTPGIDYTVSICYATSNACGTANICKTITVGSGTVVGPIGGIPYTTVGGTRTVTNALAGGTWSTSNSAVATVNPSTGVITGVSAGTFTTTYSFTNSCGCTTFATKSMWITAPRFGSSTSGNESSDEFVSMSVYPNPTSGVFTLQLDGTTGTTNVLVYDLTGRVVATNSSDATKLDIDLSNVPTGTYLIKASNGGNTYTERIVVQK